MQPRPNEKECNFILFTNSVDLRYTYLDAGWSCVTVRNSFCSNTTGQSKGYGCVEFTSKESSIKAKNHLNGTSLNNNTLQVKNVDCFWRAALIKENACHIISLLILGSLVGHHTIWL